MSPVAPEEAAGTSVHDTHSPGLNLGETGVVHDAEQSDCGSENVQEILEQAIAAQLDPVHGIPKPPPPSHFNPLFSNVPTFQSAVLPDDQSCSITLPYSTTAGLSVSGKWAAEGDIAVDTTSNHRPLTPLLKGDKHIADTDADLGSTARAEPLEIGTDVQAIVPSRIAEVDEVFDIQTHNYQLTKTHKQPIAKHSKCPPALQIRRVMNIQGVPTQVRVDIESESLYKVLLEINKDVEELDIRMRPPVADPQLFYYCLGRLQEQHELETAKVEPDRGLIADLLATINWTEEYFKSSIASFASLSKDKEISWDLLWALFPPNTLVFEHDPLVHDDRVLKLLSCRITVDHGGRQSWALSCMYLSMKGKRDKNDIFDYCKELIRIDKYDGVRKISSLPACPLGHYEEIHGIQRESIITRNLEYFHSEMLSIQCIWTSGMGTIIMNNKLVSTNIYGRVVIDPYSFDQYNPLIGLSPNIFRSVTSLDRDEYLLLSPRVFGYSLGSKNWVVITISNIEQTKWNLRAFESLVMKPGHKDLIYSLVHQHSRTTSSYDDLIAGKGQGLIGLFAGKPGCGKTLTAEAVADATQRPLYMVSAGELGVEPDEVDHQLDRVLQLAYRWNAVLVLDEADVFLQKRSLDDMSKNALVSIFLRKLEYYMGILILTTNRVNDCDPAFESRIHFSVFFPDLDYNSRWSIWEVFLKKASEADLIFRLGLHFSRHFCDLLLPSESGVESIGIQPGNGKSQSLFGSCPNCRKISRCQKIDPNMLGLIFETAAGHFPRFKDVAYKVLNDTGVSYKGFMDQIFQARSFRTAESELAAENNSQPEAASAASAASAVPSRSVQMESAEHPAQTFSTGMVISGLSGSFTIPIIDLNEDEGGVTDDAPLMTEYESDTLNWKYFFTEGDIDKLAKHRLNGRQIKNAIGTAQTIAREKGEPLSIIHIETVVGVIKSWSMAKSDQQIIAPLWKFGRKVWRKLRPKTKTLSVTKASKFLNDK